MKPLLSNLLREPPMEGIVLLNTDGSVKGDRDGYGGLARVTNGDCILSYSGRGPPVSMVYQEMKLIKRGLQLCIERGVKHIQVTTDSELMIAYIKRQKKPPWNCIHLLSLSTIV
ncbi:hypothetical protein GIB67_019780 [Kingdonia uniflora]|uniref:RNase H type-1 domain-containing protein n=1 Tax=Kingdonia uniflora TaxID=39325 RepID=A0A7J7MKC9_9MAGN|nr:hypothetical protein GIB67_019780 [Kingdonia uniflora]